MPLSILTAAFPSPSATSEPETVYPLSRAVEKRF
jgi:hypothetical protein